MSRTPGPWKYGVRRDKSIWLSLGDPTKRHYQGDLCASESDAKLITAAPDLLEALIAVMRENVIFMDMDSYALAISPIAKAEGR